MTKKREVTIHSGTGEETTFSFYPLPERGEIGVRPGYNPIEYKTPEELREGLENMTKHYPGDTAEEFKEAIEWCIEQL